MVSGDSVVLNSVYFPQGYPAGAPKNLDPVFVIGFNSTVIVSATHASWESLRSSKHLFVGTSGGGNVSEFGARALCTGLPCTFVSYKSYAGAVNDLLGGRIDAYAVNVVGPIGGLSERLKPVAVLSPSPSLMYPSAEVATINGSAVNLDGWVMLFGVNLDSKIRAKIISEVSALFTKEELVKWGFRGVSEQSPAALLDQSIKSVSR
jgi:tripartite-type tricarboxylate transporter receptor subunit TctC